MIPGSARSSTVPYPPHPPYHEALTAMYIVANWKMNVPTETIPTYMQQLSTLNLAAHQLIICPPYPYLTELGAAIHSTRANCKLGAQNVAQAAAGAQTGEVSAAMLKHMNVHHCIVGHSERRDLHHETDIIINHKIHQLQASGMGAIICIGETATQRAEGRTTTTIAHSLEVALTDVAPPRAQAPLMVAYEPRWAIGSTSTAAPADINLVLSFIRDILTKKWPHQTIPILYGGGITPTSITPLLTACALDGVLCGGVSLRSESLCSLLKAVTDHSASN